MWQISITCEREATNNFVKWVVFRIHLFIAKEKEDFSRVTWEKALELIGERLSKIPPQRQGYFATSKGLTNETYYTFTKTA